jgi:hypothetical protein
VTTARLVQNPPDGCGLLPQLVEQHYQDLVRGKPGELIAAEVLLQPVGHSGRRLKTGSKNSVLYEIVRLEPARDRHEADNIAWNISRSYEARTSTSNGQQTLPLANSPAEQRESLIEACFEWASENDVSQEDLDARFTDHFGGREHGHAETVRAGGLVQLMEFARYIGAVKDPIVGKDDDEDGDPDDGLPEPADPDEDLNEQPTTTAPDEPPAADTPKASKPAAKLAAVAAPPFEAGT